MKLEEDQSQEAEPQHGEVRDTGSHSPIHAHIHTPTAFSTMQGDSQLVRSSQVRGLAQGYLHTPLGGAEERTSSLPVTSPPALPPEPHAETLMLEEVEEVEQVEEVEEHADLQPVQEHADGITAPRWEH